MESICLIKDLYKALYQFEKSFSSANDLTINEAMLLCCLKEGDGKTAGTLSEYIGLSNSRVSKVITAVENKELICRAINQSDKRQMFFTLTDKGKAKIKDMKKAESQFDSLLDQLKSCMQKECF